MVRSGKVRTGVAFDDEIIASLDRHSAALTDLGVTRSEVVNAILGDFLDRRDSSEEVWEVVSKKRVKNRGAEKGKRSR